MNELDELTTLFAAKGIDSGCPGFYDDPRFVEVEKTNPAFLETYASFVESRHYDEQYLAQARQEITCIVDVLLRELVTDGRPGACIDLGMVLSRILEREGFWNYMVKGSLTIHFPAEAKLNPLYFWSFDVVENGRKFGAAHTWLVAPPFHILDLTIKQQPYPYGQELLPSIVAATSVEEAEMYAGDVFSPEYLYREAKGVPKRLLIQTLVPRLVNFRKSFPPASVTRNGLLLKYVPVGIGAPDKGLEEIRNHRLNGRFGAEIYNDLVLPELKKVRQRVNGEGSRETSG